MDVTVSPDGRLTFVLTDDGKVMIYDNHGNLTDNVKVGIILKPGLVKFLPMMLSG